MRMPGRSNTYGNSDVDYRYAFQGMEQDNEVSGNGNSYTTEFRQYDSRLGRWKSLDPVVHHNQSPYCAMDNNPIIGVDPDGKDVEIKASNRKEKRQFKRMLRQAKREDKGFKQWYKDRKKEDKINVLSPRGEAKDKENEHEHFKTPEYTDKTLKDGDGNHRKIETTIDGDGKESHTHDPNVKIGNYYFTKLNRSVKPKFDVGLSIGFRMYNTVILDITINRVARWESYFPGRNGEKRNFDMFYRTKSENTAHQSYPESEGGHSHPLFFCGKEWLLPCLHPEAYFRGMRGINFKNTLPPDKPLIFIRFGKAVIKIVNYNFLKRYTWQP